MDCISSSLALKFVSRNRAMAFGRSVKPFSAAKLEKPESALDSEFPPLGFPPAGPIIDQENVDVNLFSQRDGFALRGSQRSRKLT
jgi:hypothetical protein